MIGLDAPMLFREAVGKLIGQSLMPTNLGSAELMQMDAAVRERSFFSARNMFEDVLGGMKEKIATILNPVQADGRPATVGLDLATARTQIRELLQSVGYNPGNLAGTIQDLGSDQRIRLVLDMNVQAAQGFGQWRAGQDETILDAFPAQELYRAEGRKEPRNWRERWSEAGGEFYGGKMIALKNDDIWTAISAVTGQPYPPFDYNSGMSIRDVSRSKAIKYGLIDQDTRIEPERRSFETSFPT